MSDPQNTTQAIVAVKVLLRRLFVTNWKTSVCGLALLGCTVAFWLDKMTADQLLKFATLLGGAVGILSKDAVREDAVVAREDVPPVSGPPSN